MKINWRIKALLFFIIEKFELFDLLQFIQKKISKRALIIDPNQHSYINIHNKVIKKKKLKNILEFGAGRNIYQNLYLSFLNKNLNQTLVDKFKMLDIKLVNESIKIISKIFKKRYVRISSLESLNKYKIKYFAPIETSKYDQDQQYDLCINTNTLEHIPRNEIKILLKKLKKILKKNGYISSIIDYSDHYSHTDDSISKLNFLNFTKDEWKKYNFNCHYQNRLRHHDFLKLFKESGFKVIEEKILNEIKKEDKGFKYFEFKELQGYILVQNI